jgi:predicted AAA+ superfamily ATPase
MLPEYRYVSFDDYQVKTFLESDPIGFINHYSHKVIFDEVQKAPIIFDMIKNIIDNNREVNGNFILTGSIQFSMIRGIKESLAGRIGLLQLLPFERSEVPQNLRDESIYKGGYPGLVTRDYKYNNEWYSSYIETYINKDVKDISNLGKRIIKAPKVYFYDTGLISYFT